MNSLKSIILSITLLFSISNSHATSQQEQETLSYLKNSFSQVDIKRISRISQEMSLDIPTAEKFWPRYQEYLHRLIALRDKQLATLSSYASHVNDKKLDIKVAKTLLKESLAQEELRVTIRKSWSRACMTSSPLSNKCVCTKLSYCSTQNCAPACFHRFRLQNRMVRSTWLSGGVSFILRRDIDCAK